MKNRALIFYFSCILGFFAHAQDPQFSHIYAMPLHMGPSFAGATGGTRAAINGRNQWTAVKQEYNTVSAMIDHYFYGTRSGAGIVLLRDQAGAGKLTTSNIQAQYAYSININKFIALRPGIQMSFVHRSIDYSKIVFGDQLDFIQDRPNSIEPSLIENTKYIDFGASLLSIFNNIWLGATVDHLVTPNQSLKNEKSEVPIRISIYSGARFSMQTKFNNKRKRENLYVMLHYNEQESFRQALYGSYWEHNNSIFGLWYRGMPYTKSYEQYINSDALVIMFGWKYYGLQCLYSYDFTLSKLTAYSAGSHEITLTYNWNSISEKLQKSKMKVVPCPMQDNSRRPHHNQHNM